MLKYRTEVLFFAISESALPSCTSDKTGVKAKLWM